MRLSHDEQVLLAACLYIARKNDLPLPLTNVQPIYKTAKSVARSFDVPRIEVLREARIIDHDKDFPVMVMIQDLYDAS